MWRKLLRGRRQFQVEHFRLAFAEREASAAALYPIEKIRVRGLAGVYHFECDREVITGRKAGHLETTILVGPAGPDVARRPAPFLAIACKEQRRVVLDRLAATGGDDP